LSFPALVEAACAGVREYGVGDGLIASLREFA
jgi:hypothetical protein